MDCNYIYLQMIHIIIYKSCVKINENIYELNVKQYLTLYIAQYIFSPNTSPYVDHQPSTVYLRIQVDVYAKITYISI